MCLEYYRSDQCHYFSSPELSWGAMFKMVVIKLDHVLDTDMYQFIEKDMRRGVRSTSV